jgi:hypothetical protein
MPVHEHPDYNFEVPKDWADKTVVAYTAPARAGQKMTPNLILTRTPAEGDETVAQYADKQLVELAKKLEHFHLIERKEQTLGGLPAVALTFTWHTPGGPLHQRTTFVKVRGWLMLAFTFTAMKGEFSAHEPALNAIMSSLQFPESSARNGHDRLRVARV